jgi:tetratricopeptide (TPR) repeat protein
MHQTRFHGVERACRPNWTNLLSAIIIASCFAASSPASAVTDTEKEKKWEQLQRSGTTALDSNEYWKAEPLLKSAVIQAGTFGEEDIRLAKSLGELGRLYAVRGRFNEAEPLYEEELCVKEKALGRGNGQVIPAMGKLIKFYLLYGTVSKADPLTEDVLVFVEGKLKEPLEQEPGKLTLKKGAPLQGWAGQATPVMRDPLLEWAITCDDLGNIYRIRGNYDVADRLFKAALDLKATVLGKEHLSLANSYDSLAEICQSKNEMQDAESYFQDALGVTEKVLSSADSAAYRRMDKLARCYIKEGKYQQAEETYQRVLKLLPSESAGGSTRARFLLALGCLYDDQRNFAAAAPALQQALVLAEQTSGPLSADLVPYLRKYAYTLYYLGRRGETEQLRARASNIIGDSEIERKPDMEQPLKAQAQSLAGDKTK